MDIGSGNEISAYSLDAVLLQSDRTWQEHMCLAVRQLLQFTGFFSIVCTVGLMHKTCMCQPPVQFQLSLSSSYQLVKETYIIIIFFLL